MAISGTINKAAFYCRVNQRGRDYTQYLDTVIRKLEKEYGKQEWDLQIFFEEDPGADPDRREVRRLKAEIIARKIDAVVSMRAAAITCELGQFMEFMVVCRKNRIKVVCTDRIDNAQPIFDRIQQFLQRYADQGM